MKLSDTTISVLKNYSSINQNLKIGASNNLVTMSAMKNIVAQAKVEETFEKDVAIYDLNEFLAAMSLFESPELDFQNEYVMMGNEGKTSSLKYWYSDPSVVTTVTKDITMPSTEVTKAAAVIGAPDMVLENGSLKVTDKKNQTANAFSMNVAKSDSDVDYAFWFKVENLKLMPGTYDVSVSSKKISYFHNTSVDIGYYIALEPESHYGQ